MYDAYGITPIKVALEYSVAIIAVLVLLKLNSNLQREHLIKFKYPKEKMVGLNYREMMTLFSKVGNEHENPLAIRVNNNEENSKDIIRSYLNSEGKEIKALINADKINSGILVVASDVKQEQEIKNLNLQAQTILNAIITPTMILDDAGKIVACNNSYADLIEIEYNDIIGIDIHKLYDTLNFSGKGNMDTFKKSDFKNEVTEWLIETPKGKKKQLQITTSVITNYNSAKMLE